jgi:hypothetical protein
MDTMNIKVYICLLLLLLSACATAPPVTDIYQDNRLCFAVELPADWSADGVTGGFASFSPANNEQSFRITNVHLDDTPTLTDALAELRRGSLGHQIAAVREITVDHHPAVWVTVAPTADFTFLALVIAPDCGDGSHALFISATNANQAQFAAFLTYVQIL